MGRRRRWPRVVVGVLLCVVLLVDGAALVLAQLTSPLRPPVGAAGVGKGSHGRLLSGARVVARITATLRARR